VRKTAAVTAAALGVVVAVVFRFRPDTQPSTPPDVGPAAQETEPVALAVHVHDGGAGAPGGQPATVAPQGADRAARAGSAPDPVRDDRRRAFAVEPIDAGWAPGAEADLLATFAQMQGLKLVDLRVECRATMCRLESSQPNAPAGEHPPSFDSLLHSLGLKPRWMAALVGPSGAGAKSFAYLRRDGLAQAPPPGEPREDQ